MYKQTSSRILRQPMVRSLCGVSRSTVYGWLNPNSSQYQPDFPKPIRIGKSAVGWREDEILQFIESRERCYQSQPKQSLTKDKGR